MNYYALLVALIIVSALLLKGYQEGNKRYVIVACLLLFSIYGLRNTYVIGGDTKSSYLGNFWRMQAYSWKEVFDYTDGKNILFYLFTKAFITFVSDDYQLYITVISAFVTICVGVLIYRYSPNPLQSILYHFGLLYFIFHFSALKQSIAMAILLLAFIKIIDRKPFAFVLLVLLAGQFHFPSLVFLPAYWIADIPIERKFLSVFAIALIVTYIFRNQLLNFMLNLYRESDAQEDISEVRFLRNKALIMIVIIFVATVFRVPMKEDRCYCILLKFMGIAVLLQTFCGYDNTFERLADYYFQFSIVFIPMAFDKKAERRSLLSWRLMNVIDDLAPYLFCAFGIYRFLDLVAHAEYLSPYRFFFQK